MTKKYVSVEELERILLDAAHKRPTTADVGRITIAPRAGTDGGDWYVVRFERDRTTPGADDAGIARELDDIAVLLREVYSVAPAPPAKAPSPLL